MRSGKAAGEAHSLPQINVEFLLGVLSLDILMKTYILSRMPQNALVTPLLCELHWLCFQV